MPLKAPSRGRPGRGFIARAMVPRDERQESFLRLALTHGLVSAGDAMVTVSLAGTIFFTTNINAARPKLVLALLLTMAPFAVVAPFLGPAIDRSRGGRRIMIVASAAGRSAVCLYMATVVHGLMLYPCALVILVLSKAHAVAKSALVPATVDNPSEYVKAGGRLAIVATVAGFLGALPAAAVWKLFDASWAIRLAAVVYAVGAVMAVRIRPAPPATLEPPDHVDEEVRSRGVSLAASCMITLRACSGFLTFAVAFIFRRAGAAAWWYGFVGGCALAGGFIGNVVGPRVRRFVPEERILVVVLALVAAAGAAAAKLDSHLGLAMLAGVMGFADGVGQLSFDSIVQRDGSEGARARSFARFEASFQLAWVGAALIPVVLPVPTWVACVVLATAAAASGIAYVAGRHNPPRLAGEPDTGGTAAPPPPEMPPGVPGWPVPAVALEGGGAPGPAEAGTVELGVWSAVRPEPSAVHDRAAPDPNPVPNPSPVGDRAAGGPTPSRGTPSPLSDWAATDPTPPMGTPPPGPPSVGPPPAGVPRAAAPSGDGPAGEPAPTEGNGAAEAGSPPDGPDPRGPRRNPKRTGQG